MIRTFDLLPGITIGDIGKKMGRDGIGERSAAGLRPLLTARQWLYPIHLRSRTSRTYAHEAYTSVETGRGV
jgi:hypothetical protein